MLVLLVSWVLAPWVILTLFFGDSLCCISKGTFCRAEGVDDAVNSDLFAAVKGLFSKYLTASLIRVFKSLKLFCSHDFIGLSGVSSGLALIVDAEKGISGSMLFCAKSNSLNGLENELLSVTFILLVSVLINNLSAWFTKFTLIGVLGSSASC
ncbi:hypothetical protein PSDI105340_15900 [Pseudoalteromonas distincta]